MSIQFQSGLPVTSRSGAILKTTVVREKWELNNDDIELVIKTTNYILLYVVR